MESFNFVFSLFGLLLGLALAEVLGGFGGALQERHKLRIGWLTPLLGLFVAFDLTSFWTWAWMSRALVPSSYIVLLGCLVITGLYYLAARMVFPRDHAEWPDFDVYYFRHRRLVLGGVLLSNLLLDAGQFALGANPVATRLEQVTFVLFVAELVALMLVRGRGVSIAIMLVLLATYPVTGVIAFRLGH